MCFKQGRTCIKPFDQDSAFIGCAGAVGAADQPHRFSFQPKFGGCEKLIRDILIIQAIEEPEQAILDLKDLIVMVVDDGSDRANGLIIPNGQEQFPLR